MTRTIFLLITAVAISGWASAQKKDAPDTRKTSEKAASQAAQQGGESEDLTTFDDAKVGATPQGFTIAETKGAGTPATWNVETMKDDPKHKNAVKVESKNKEAVFNILLTDKTYPADLDVTVQILPGSGEDDQGGGIVWRAKDANNYYIARWNPLEKNLRLYKVEDGKRTQLGTADVEGDPKKWHEIEIVQRGAKIAVEFDGKKVINVEDASIKDGGKVGLWTKADASTWFDDLSIEWKK